MTQKKSGLGRGLGAIIPNTGTTAATATDSDGPQLRDLPVDAIIPNSYQPRDRFDEEELVSLTESIRELGVLQPILVREAAEGSYELIAGERRWRAAQRAGLSVIPAVVREVDNRAALEQAVVENLHRADLNAIEEAAAYQQLIDEFSLTQDDVAQRVGKSRSAVTNALRLFQLPPNVQRLIVDGVLSAGHGRALLACEPAQLQSLAQQAVDDQLSVRALESLVKGPADDSTDEADQDEDTESDGPNELDEVGGTDRPSSPGSTPPAAVLELEHLLEEHLETKVAVSLGGSRGKVTIAFADVDDLERIFRRMTGQN